MGCDIHLHVEVKIDGVWHHYAHPSIGRDYELFAKLAGVRNYHGTEPIALPRGVPDDATIITKMEFDDCHCHSHSWISAEEIVALEDWYRTRSDVQARFGQPNVEYDLMRCYFFHNTFGGFHKYPDERPDGVEDLRFVFAFDN